MFKDSISKLVPNQLSSAPFDQEYIKPAKIKAKVKQKPQPIPLQDQTNRLSSFQNQSAPVTVVLDRCQEDSQSETSENQAIRNLELNQRNTGDENWSYQPQPTQNEPKIETDFQPASHQQQKQQKEKVAEQIEKKQQAKVVNENIRESGQSTVRQKSRKKSQRRPKKKLEQIFEERKLHIIRTAEKNRKIFNLELSDSSENQHQEELDQNKGADFKQNELRNIFDDRTDYKQPTSDINLKVSFDSDDNKPKPNAQPQPAQKRNKFILDNFDSDSSEEDKEGGEGQNKSKNHIRDEAFEEELEVVRNMNVQKLKVHFQFVKIDSNFLVFCPIPPQCKTSLIVKRDTEKSQYFIFDSELVCQVMKVQKSIGGVYRFYMTKQGSNKDGKSQFQQIGKMKSNFLGTEFHCYAYKQEDKGSKKQKYQCISVKYDVNILGLNGPRKMKIYAGLNPLPSEANLLETYEKSPPQNESIRVYQSKTPKWMPELNAYVLNLRGTASHSSIKNCIIVDAANQNKQYLIFGKKSKDIFNLEIKNPWTVLQGAAFAISSFERKLACE